MMPNYLYKKAVKKFDLVIVAIFQDKIISNFLFGKPFIVNLKKIMSVNGGILFNTIASNTLDENRNNIFEQQLLDSNFTVERFPNIEGKNELLILKNKLQS